MKKTVSFVIVVTLCLTILLGCTQNTTEANTAERFGRVVCLKENGIIVWIEGLEYVYVKHVNPDLNIKTLNTVVMVFSETDLEPTSETFLNFDGSELSYSYILKEPNSIRLADPAKGEPTFG